MLAWEVVLLSKKIKNLIAECPIHCSANADVFYTAQIYKDTCSSRIQGYILHSFNKTHFLKHLHFRKWDPETLQFCNYSSSSINRSSSSCEWNLTALVVVDSGFEHGLKSTTTVYLYYYYLPILLLLDSWYLITG